MTSCAIPCAYVIKVVVFCVAYFIFKIIQLLYYYCKIKNYSIIIIVIIYYYTNYYRRTKFVDLMSQQLYIIRLTRHGHLSDKLI